MIDDPASLMGRRATHHSTMSESHMCTTAPVAHKWFKFREYEPVVCPGRFKTCAYRA